MCSPATRRAGRPPSSRACPACLTTRWTPWRGPSVSSRRRARPRCPITASNSGSWRTPRKVEKQRQASRRVPVVVAQQSAETIATHDGTALMASRWLWSNQLIAEALMIPLRMIMGEVLADDLGEESFTQHERLLEGLFLDGAYKSLAVRIEIGTPRGQEHRFDAAVLQEHIEGLRELGITIVEQVPFAKQKTLHGIRQLPSTLLHESRRRMRRDAGDLHAACGQLHHYQHIVGHQAMPGGDFHREEVRGRQDLPVELEELRPAHAHFAALWG